MTELLVRTLYPDSHEQDFVSDNLATATDWIIDDLRH